MPLYDYECEACGSFTALRPMAQFRVPCACPTCGIDAPRAIVSAPTTVSGRGLFRGDASAGNELDAGGRDRVNPVHPAGCGCCMRRSPFPAALTNSGRVFSSGGPLRRGAR